MQLSAPVAAEQCTTVDAEEGPNKMPDTIKAGTILIKDGTFLPDALRFESEPCATGWRLVKNLDGRGLGPKINEAGWTFFWLAAENGATVFCFDGPKTLLRAAKRIVAKLNRAPCRRL